MKLYIKNITEWMKNHPYSYSLFYLVFYLIIFFMLDFISVGKYLIHCPIDDLIPFNSNFYLLYASWFIAFPGSLLFFVLYNKEDYQNLSFILMNGATITFIIYALFPTTLDLRVNITGSSIFDQLLKMTWSVDPPCNVCPSLHCSISAAIAITCMMSQKLKREHPRMTVITILWMIGICISTMFVKQHSIIDVICGIGLSMVLAIVCYKVNWHSMLEHTVFKKLL